MTSQEPFLVGVEYGDERHLRQVETLAKEVDAHQDIVHARPEIVHYLHPVESGHVAVYVVGLHVVVEQIFRQFLGHALRERGNQDALVLMAAREYLVEQVVYLVFRGSYLYLRVK